MEAPLHKLCGTRHWSARPCPAMKSSGGLDVGTSSRASTSLRKRTVEAQPEINASDARTKLPVKDTRKTDRHKPGYQAMKQREYRARKKAEK